MVFRLPRLRHVAQAQGRRLLRVLQLRGSSLPAGATERRKILLFERIIVKRKLFAFALIGCTLLLAGCNTVHGMGQDLQDAGQAIERASNR